MSDALPPSKFGAGYTYSGPPEPDAPPTPPPYGQSPHLYSAAPTQAAPAHNGLAATQQAPVTYQPAVSYPASPPAYAPTTPGWAPPVGHPASGGTAISAAILALPSAIWQSWQSYSFITVMSIFGAWGQFEQSAAHTYMVAMAILSAVAALSYFVGAVMLLNRNIAGSGWITVGSLAALGQVVATFIFINATLHELSNWLSALVSVISPRAGSPGTALLAQDALGTAIALGLTVGIPVLLIILARTRATRRWCQAPRSPYGP